MDLPVKTIKISDLNPAEYNPNTMSTKELNKLSKSVKAHGIVDPIIVNLKDNTIIGGHHRVKALMKQNVETVNMAMLGDVGWVFNDANLKIPDKDTEKIINVALNNINGEMDESKLTKVLTELEKHNANYKLTGFDELDLERLKLDHEILIDNNALQQTVDSLQTPTSNKETNSIGNDNEIESNFVAENNDNNNENIDDEMEEMEMLEEMNESLVRYDDDYDLLDEFPCPHCGEMISLDEAIVDKISEKDGLS